MRYAAYGSNLHPLRLRRRTPSARLLGTARVCGRELRFHKLSDRDDSGKCNLVECRDRSVYVAVYELSPAEIPALDEIEGVGCGYDRQWITLSEFGECFTYLAAPSHIDDHLKPYSWYRELVVTGCESLRFPPEYVRSVRSTEAVLDPDAARHLEHMQLVAEARSANP